MRRRATASISSQGTPGRTAAVAAAWASLEHAVQAQELRVRAAALGAGDPDRARDVGPVAAQRPADVDDDRLAAGDDALARVVVRRRAVGSRGDDRELGVLVALGDEALADLAGDIRLGPPDERAVRDRGHDPVGGLGGRPQQGDLVRVLAHAQRPQHARRHGEPRPGQHALEAQHERRAEPVGHGHGADPTAPPSRSPPPAARRPAPSGPRSPPRSRSRAPPPRPRGRCGRA